MKYCIILPMKSQEAHHRVVETFTREFGGCTAQVVQGFWRQSEGDVTQEFRDKVAAEIAALPPEAREEVEKSPPTYARSELNALVWSFGPSNRESVLKTLASEVQEIADRDAVLFWTEPGDAQFAYRPATPGRVRLETPIPTPIGRLN